MRFLCAIVLLAFMPPMAAGAEEPGNEFRAGIMYHDAALFVRPGARDQLKVEEPGPDVNFEFLFASPDFLKAVWSPRPHIGVTLNTAGETSQAYLGLTLRTDFAENLFVELAGGGAVHNGKTLGTVPDARYPYTTADGRKLMGCRYMFRGAVAVGMQINERYSLSLGLDHISNGHLCQLNPGLDTVGLRLGYRF